MPSVYAIASILTVAGYLAFAAAAWRSPLSGVRTRLLVSACLTHAAWAASRFVEPFSAWLDPVLLNGHVALWAITVVLLAAGESWRRSHAALRNGPVTACAALFAAHTVLTVAHTLHPSPTLLALSSALNLLTLAAAIVGLVGVLAAAGEAHRWALKLVCIPLVASFAYDLYIETQVLTFGSVAPQTVAMRTIVDALAMGPVALGLWRLTRLGDVVELSHRAVVYATALIVIGVYLTGTAAAAWAVSFLAPGTPAAVIALGVIFALATLALALTSGWVRAAVKTLVARHIRRRKYDFYDEWRRFMRTLNQDVDTAPLEKRVIRACADPVEVPAGTLWRIPEKGRPFLVEMWHGRIGAEVGPKLRSDAFKTAADGEACVLRPQDLEAIADQSRSYASTAAAAVPLAHGQRVAAFILLARPRASTGFDAADRDLLLLIAEQCASHISEKWAAAELARERQFARFAKQYAFVAHDLKNVVSSLNVLTKNFDRHGHKPAFREEMQKTLRQTTDNLRQLLRRLDADGGEREEERILNLLDSVQEAAADAATAAGRPPTAVRTYAGTRNGGPHVSAPPKQLQAVVAHLIGNALEASESDRQVDAKVDVAGQEAVIEVTDRGCGMTQHFIDRELFEPFRSTKPGGFGIGSFQCQQFAREQGGELDVISTRGVGTTIRLRLPAAEPVTGSRLEAAGGG